MCFLNFHERELTIENCCNINCVNRFFDLIEILNNDVMLFF